ncbi:MAG: hypothetical protein ACJ8GV_07195 [Luteimonas sp.]
MRIAPGRVETDASVALAERLATEAGIDDAGGKAIITQSLGGIPIGLPSTPDEVANLIVFVASPRGHCWHRVRDRWRHRADGVACSHCLDRG